MKLIEALKKIKDLYVKSDDLIGLVRKNCAISSIETPEYEDQRGKVSGWIQAHSDLQKEILRLRFAIQKTNILTEVTIELGANQVTKTIAEWIHRRRELAKNEFDMWNALTNRNITEGMTRGPSGESNIEIKIVRFFSPDERDVMKDLYFHEPSKIDASLEIVNATTDLIDKEVSVPSI